MSVFCMCYYYTYPEFVWICSKYIQNMIYVNTLYPYIHLPSLTPTFLASPYLFLEIGAYFCFQIATQAQRTHKYTNTQKRPKKRPTNQQTSRMN